MSCERILSLIVTIEITNTLSVIGRAILVKINHFEKVKVREILSPFVIEIIENFEIDEVLI